MIFGAIAYNLSKHGLNLKLSESIKFTIIWFIGGWLLKSFVLPSDLSIAASFVIGAGLIWAIGKMFPDLKLTLPQIGIFYLILLTLRAIFVGTVIAITFV